MVGTMTIDHAIPQLRSPSLRIPDKTNPVCLSNFAVFPRISSISCFVPTPDITQPPQMEEELRICFRQPLSLLSSHPRTFFLLKLPLFPFLCFVAFFLFHTVGIKFHHLHVQLRFKSTHLPLHSTWAFPGIRSTCVFGHIVTESYENIFKKYFVSFLYMSFYFFYI